MRERTLVERLQEMVDDYKAMQDLCAKAADTLERTLSEGERFEPSMQAFINELRKAAG